MVLLASIVYDQNVLSSSAAVDACHGSCIWGSHAVEYEVVVWEGHNKIRQKKKRYRETMVIAPHAWLSGL